MSDKRQAKVLVVVRLMSELDPQDLDASTVETLCQLAYWCHQLLASIWVKSMGRVASRLTGLVDPGS